MVRRLCRWLDTWVSKSVNGVLTQYCYEDGRLVSENKDGDVVKYIYSSKNGTVMLDGFEYSGKSMNMYMME